MYNLSERYNNIPDIIESQIILKKPNSPIRIFKGNFELINIENEAEKIDVNGYIYFEWFPNYGCCFSGTICNCDLDKYFKNPRYIYKVVINTIEIGNSFITNTTTSTGTDNSQIKGVFQDKITVGEIEKSIDLVSFSVPNLKPISGEAVKKITSTNIRTSRSRIKLKNNEWNITIDKDIQYDNLKKELDIIGGYNILYSGNIIKNNNEKFTFKESNEILSCLDVFLSFINGRRLSCLFSTGFNEGSKNWTDYSAKQVAAYKKNITSFHFNRNVNSLDLMWKEFSSIWQSDSGKDFLTSIIHWYIESNNQAGLIDGSIIMAQAGLEQLYYWTLPNNKHPKDTPSKFRDLIKYLNVNNAEILDNYINLKVFAENYIEKHNHRDIAGIVTTIRNNIVHPIENVKITLETKYEAWQLCLWLIEITLLKILNHQGRYFDRARGVNFDYTIS